MDLFGPGVWILRFSQSCTERHHRARPNSQSRSRWAGARLALCARRSAVFVLLLAAGALGDATPSQAQRATQPPVRPLGPITASCPVAFGRIVGLRQLSDGSVIVSDNARMRLLLFDSALAHPKVLLDTLSTAQHRYTHPLVGAGTLNGLLSPFADDSTLFLDLPSQALLVLGPRGDIGRVMAVPGMPIRILGASVGWIGLDPLGRFVWNAPPRWGSLLSLPRDTVISATALVRTTPFAGSYDSLASVHFGVSYPTGSLMLNPVEAVDDWTLLADGSVAIVRAHDFHIEIIRPDGTTRSTGKVPFDWQRLTDSAKHALTDSARAYASAHPVFYVAPGADGPDDWKPGQPIPKQFQRVRGVVPDSMLPDYIPPFAGHTTRSDAAMHIWIQVLSLLPSQLSDSSRLAVNDKGANPPPPDPSAGGAVYDVIDTTGTLIDRVQIPGGTIIVGFGPGVVYLASREGDGYHLVRARIR